MSISTAFRAFFAALGNSDKSRQIADILNGTVSETPQISQTPSPRPPVPSPQAASAALTLMAAFQREARFLDFLQEDLSAYDDAQIGAASRDVHRLCREVVARMFAPAPLLDGEEGTPVTLPEPLNPAQFSLTGNVSADPPPTRGTLIHHGWRATKCEIPQWTGTAEDAEILAPAEVEV